METMSDCEYFLAARRHTRHAQGIFICFSARVDEEDAVESFWSNTRQFFGSLGANLQSHYIALKD